MSRKLSGLRIKANLSEVIEHRLKSYSVAAVAAGVSMFALAQPAEAEVLITREIIPINGPVTIDLNNDGIADFQFSFHSSFIYHEAIFQTWSVKPLAGGAVVGDPGRPPNSYASALNRGAKIGPSAHFSSKGRAVMGRVVCGASISGGGSCGTYGDWSDVSNRFLGVKFLIDGETHYGWVRMSGYGQIDGYAYETIPNKPIFATPPAKGQSTDTESEQTGRSISPPSLGMLALGVRGLPLWRRDETLLSNVR
ncbi:MAG: hypothetical protein ABSA78_17415 [Candidatus Sulfotelmatobacter sp.]|jgi:hypothetical protein